MKRTIILISVVCLLAGCGIYKPYSRPVVDVDNLYRDTTAVDSTSSGTLSWKELFTDTRLQELIIQGLEQNTDLRIARLKVEEAEAVLMNARISYLPAVSANASGTISRFDGKNCPKPIIQDSQPLGNLIYSEKSPMPGKVPRLLWKAVGHTHRLYKQNWWLPSRGAIIRLLCSTGNFKSASPPERTGNGQSRYWKR